MTEFKTNRTWGPPPRYPNVLSYCPPTETGLIAIAGPCSIESPEQIAVICEALAPLDITYMRGGVTRAGTYPPKEFGLKIELLQEWRHQADHHGLRIIVEVVDLRDLEMIGQYADAIQVGARQQQNYGLLDAAKDFDGHVTLKRGLGNTLDEFLGAAEYLTHGRAHPILIERGGSSYHTHVRWDLSVSLIAAVKTMSRMPVLIDASHGTGRRDLVGPMTLAGLAAGADGFLCEVHPDPCNSLSDADQAYDLAGYGELLSKARWLHTNLTTFDTAGCSTWIR